MYKTINNIFQGGGKKKGGAKGSLPAQFAEKHGSSPSSPGAGSSIRPESPLRLGSPSLAAIGESTLKRIIKRAFPPESILENEAAKEGGKSTFSSSSGSDVKAEILAFEIGSIMRRALEIYDSMAEKMLSSLRSNLQAPGVVTLVSSDLRELWGLAGLEKQGELHLLASRVSVLGRKCSDTRLHYLQTLFIDLDKPDANFSDFAVSAPEADLLIRFMREQAEATGNLKSEMEAIQLLHNRIQEFGEWNKLQDMVSQGKVVEKLQGHCLWSYNLDYLVQLLVIITCHIRKRVFASFGHTTFPPSFRTGTIGSSGMALHYANIVVLVERIIQQPDVVMGSTRDDLYDMLPRSIQYQLRLELQNPMNFAAEAGVETNLKRGLLLLPTMAHNTILWHSIHTPGAALALQEVVFQVQTFYYANKSAVDATLVDVLVGLCRICGVESPIRTSTRGGKRPVEIEPFSSPSDASSWNVSFPSSGAFLGQDEEIGNQERQQQEGGRDSAKGKQRAAGRAEGPRRAAQQEEEEEAVWEHQEKVEQPQILPKSVSDEGPVAGRHQRRPSAAAGGGGDGEGPKQVYRRNRTLGREGDPSPSPAPQGRRRVGGRGKRPDTPLVPDPAAEAAAAEYDESTSSSTTSAWAHPVASPEEQKAERKGKGAGGKVRRSPHRGASDSSADSPISPWNGSSASIEASRSHSPTAYRHADASDPMDAGHLGAEGGGSNVPRPKADKEGVATRGRRGASPSTDPPAAMAITFSSSQSSTDSPKTSGPKAAAAAGGELSSPGAAAAGAKPPRGPLSTASLSSPRVSRSTSSASTSAHPHPEQRKRGSDNASSRHSMKDEERESSRDQRASHSDVSPSLAPSTSRRGGLVRSPADSATAPHGASERDDSPAASTGSSASRESTPSRFSLRGPSPSRMSRRQSPSSSEGAPPSLPISRSTSDHAPHTTTSSSPGQPSSVYGKLFPRSGSEGTNVGEAESGRKSTTQSSGASSPSSPASSGKPFLSSSPSRRESPSPGKPLLSSSPSRRDGSFLTASPSRREGSSAIPIAKPFLSLSPSRREGSSSASSSPHVMTRMLSRRGFKPEVEEKEEEAAVPEKGTKAHAMMLTRVQSARRADDLISVTRSEEAKRSLFSKSRSVRVPQDLQLKQEEEEEQRKQQQVPFGRGMVRSISQHTRSLLRRPSAKGGEGEGGEGSSGGSSGSPFRRSRSKAASSGFSDGSSPSGGGQAEVNSSSSSSSPRILSRLSSSSSRRSKDSLLQLEGGAQRQRSPLQPGMVGCFIPSAEDSGDEGGATGKGSPTATLSRKKSSKKSSLRPQQSGGGSQKVPAASSSSEATNLAMSQEFAAAAVASIKVAISSSSSSSPSSTQTPPAAKAALGRSASRKIAQSPS